MFGELKHPRFDNVINIMRPFSHITANPACMRACVRARARERASRDSMGCEAEAEEHVSGLPDFVSAVA